MSDDVGPIRLAPGVELSRDTLQFKAVASGGPGGQHVNKTASSCELRVAVVALGLSEDVNDRLRAAATHWLTSDDTLVIVSSVTRSFRSNRDDALSRLSELVRDSLIRPKRRRPTRPTYGSVKRRLATKGQQSERKQNRNWKPE